MSTPPTNPAQKEELPLEPSAPMAPMTVAVEVQSALANVQTQANVSERAGMLSVEAPRITSLELETVKTALEHPPPKPDFAATMLSVLAGVGLVIKAWKDAQSQGSTLDALLAASGVAVISIQLWRYFNQLRQKHPFHAKALKYVDDLVRERRSESK